MITAADFCSSERPLRDYEVLSQVLAGWNQAKRENLFVVKRCSLCECLTLRVSPTSDDSCHFDQPALRLRIPLLSVGDSESVPERRRLGPNLLNPEEEVVEAIP